MDVPGNAGRPRRACTPRPRADRPTVSPPAPLAGARGSSRRPARGPDTGAVSSVKRTPGTMASSRARSLGGDLPALQRLGRRGVVRLLELLGGLDVGGVDVGRGDVARDR